MDVFYYKGRYSKKIMEGKKGDIKQVQKVSESSGSLARRRSGKKHILMGDEKITIG